MSMTRAIAAGGLVALAAGLALTAGGEKEDKSVPMFNGKDLSGWVNVNCAPSTFFVKGDEIVTTGRPTGFLRTTRQYENFVAEFDWMHVNRKEVGNSGFFVWADPLPAVGSPYTRGIEVQVLVNLEKAGHYTSQGDLFSIWGATCKPDRPHPQGWMRCLPGENRCKGGGEWNHYKVVAIDGTIKLHVNGKEVSGLSACRPRKGYLALESEGAECHFRNLKITELPSTNPKPDEVADEDRGFHSLYTGLDLTGWKADGTHWKPRDWKLAYDGKGTELRTDRAFGDAEFVVDFSFPMVGAKPCTFAIPGGGDGASFLTAEIGPKGAYLVNARNDKNESAASGTVAGFKPAGSWNRLSVTIKGDSATLIVNGHPAGRVSVSGRTRGDCAVHPQGPMEFGNFFVRETKD